MKAILKIMIHDFKQINTNVVALVIVMGLCILPSLYAWFNINSNWEPYNEDATANLKIAVYNEDEGVDVGSTELCVGDAIVEALEKNHTIGWVFPEDERSAINGVYSGKYYAAIVIPNTFSSDLTGILENITDGGNLLYYSNEKKNAIGTKITNKAQLAVERQINQKVFQTLTEVLCKIGKAMNESSDEDEITMSVATALELFHQDIEQNIKTLDSLDQATAATETTMNTLSALGPKIIADVQNDLSRVNAPGLALSGLQTASVRISDYADVMEKGNATMADTRTLLEDLLSIVESMQEDVNSFSDDKKVQEFLAIIAENPQDAGEYFSSLVDVQTQTIYPTENYGSAMAPFYTILALWVGALILVAVLHAKVKPFDHTTKFNGVQAYFGRYALFFVIGQVQTVICVLGELFFLQIQCKHPVYFWCACATVSFVFTLLIYSLTAAFGHVGEALAVILMVVQVAGAGGTFPIEMLPRIYRKIYQFMPFPYGMDALKECISGAYGKTYLYDLLTLGYFVLGALFVGVLLRIPFVKLNGLIEKSKESSDLMV